MKNVILTDFVPKTDWEFVEGIKKSTNKDWTVEFKANGVAKGKFSQIRRYFYYFLFPFSVFQNREQYECIVSWQQFYGIILAFYCSIFHVKNAPKIVVMAFIYKDKKGFAGRIYKKFMSYVVHSGYVDRFVVFSKYEKEYYAQVFDVDPSVFYSEVLGVEHITLPEVIEKGNYYLAAGRSNRDYTFLIQNWPKDRPLHIVCDVLNINTEENITIYNKCYQKEYFDQIAKARAIIVPMDNIRISSGQLVALQAMMMGKPVIASYNETLCEYIENGVNGLIIEKTKENLLQAMEKLEDNSIYDYICRNSAQRFEERFTEYAMGMRMGAYCS